MKWQVELVGDDSNLAELSKSFNSEKQKLFKEGGHYFFSSSDFNEIADADIVRRKSEVLIGFINGGSKLIEEFKKPIIVGNIEWLDDKGKRNTYVYPGGAVLTTGFLRPTLIIDGKEQESFIFNDLAKWVSLAKQDVNVAKVLNYLQTGSKDVVTLYKIFEIIRDDVGGQEFIANNGWSTLEEIKSFRGTANNPDVIGDKARHGFVGKHPLPKNPMSLDELKLFIRNLVKRWLEFKLSCQKMTT